MKKIIAITLAAATAVIFAGCGESKESKRNLEKNKMIYTLFIFNVMIILHLLVRMLVNFIDNKPILEVTEVDILLAGKVAILATFIMLITILI